MLLTSNESHPLQLARKVSDTAYEFAVVACTLSTLLNIVRDGTTVRKQGVENERITATDDNSCSKIRRGAAIFCIRYPITIIVWDFACARAPSVIDGLDF